MLMDLQYTCLSSFMHFCFSTLKHNNNNNMETAPTVHSEREGEEEEGEEVILKVKAHSVSKAFPILKSIHFQHKKERPSIPLGSLHANFKSV